MKHIPCLLAFLCSVLPLSLKAQGYRCVDPEREALFSYHELSVGSEYETALRIDSVKTAEEATVLYPMRNIRQTGETCFTPFGPSWIGDRIEVEPDGTTRFFNYLMDTILIKTRAALNEEWIAYRDDNLYVKCEVYRHGMESFLEIEDSLKRIRFQAYNFQNNAINHSLNVIELWLSKNHGLVRTPDFYFFPDHEEYLADGYEQFTLLTYEEYILKGLTNPSIGLKPIQGSDIWNYNIGDVFHIHHGGHYFYQGYQAIIEVIDALIMNENTILYTFDRIERTWDECDNYYCPEYTRDTVIKEYNLNDLSDFILLPGEISIDSDTGYAQRILQQGDMVIYPGCWTKFFKSDIESACFYTECSFFEQPYDFKWYGRGLGGPYYEYEDYSNSVYRVHELLYYKKGDREQGTPLEFLSVFQETVPERLLIYPNPATSHINIQLANQGIVASYLISDCMGRIIRQSDEISVTALKIDIADMPSGLYIIRITDASGDQQSDLFVKQ